MGGSDRWHAVAVEKVEEAFSTHPAEGLGEKEAARRFREKGANAIVQKGGETLLGLLVRHLHNPVTYVLFASGVIALLMQQLSDGIVVLAVIVINLAIGILQEYRANRAIRALAAMVPQLASVLRGGRRRRISVEQVVPGDILEFAEGERIGADVRLIEAHGLRIDESLLTGESAPVMKQVEPVDEGAPIATQTSMGFKGTLVSGGRGRGIVVATGMQTQLGAISELLGQVEEIKTPLVERLEHLMRILTGIIVGTAAGLFGLALIRSFSMREAALGAISLAVGAIPEGLPAIITIALAVGAERMAQRKAVVRKLPAIETVGSTTVICSDKTGTLTQNRLIVQEIYTPQGRYRLDEVRQGGAPTDVVALFEAAVLCNDAVMTAEGKPEGDPTETALVAAALKVGVKVAAVRERYPRQAEVPFDSHRKWMATLHGGPSTSIILKGSPESLFGKIALHEFPDLEAEVHKMAESGLRVLAICQEECGEGEKALTEEACRGPYRFLGLVGMGDPPRPEAARSIALCRQAGIEVKMITGDHPRTAGAIGKQLGFSGVPLTGSEMDAMDNETFKREALARQIFARVTPAHKLRLVQVFQQERHVVTMTGDGVNDAPALKQAEIGVAMGSGTVVAQEAADLVLLDDRFSSIEAAVEEGRRVYQNIVKSIAFILPTNFALATIFLAAVLFFPMIGEEKVLPLIPSQILWINLVSAVGLSLPLAFEPIERDAMQRPPRPRNEPILTRFIWFRTLIVSLLSTCSTLALFLWELRHLRDLPFDEAIATAQTTAATTVILFQAFYLLQCRSLGGQPPAKGNPLLWGGIGLVALFQALFIFLPLFQEAFHTRPLSAASFFKAVAAASLIIPVVMVEKWIRSRRSLQNRKGVGH